MTENETYDKPTIWTDDYDLARQVDEAWKALVAHANADAREPHVVVRDNVLVRMVASELQPYNEHSLTHAVSRAARFAKRGANGLAKPSYPPSQMVKAILNLHPDEWDGAPPVYKVTDVPVLGPDGALVREPGLSGGILYVPASGMGDAALRADEVADVDEVQWARDLLLVDLLGDFDFDGAASKANALGLVFLPFVRELIGDSPTPMHAVIAPQAGSGKTTLAQACLIPGCGLVSLAPEPRNDDELRKLITSALLSGRPTIAFDNFGQGRRLESATLAMALTAPRWTDRILGVSRDASLSVRCVWVLTGNNVQTSAELADRICLVRLEARDGVPARTRPAGDFAHRDLLGWALANRARLAAAVLTLVNHWLAGPARMRPDGTFDHADGLQPTDQTMGSYTRWADVVGGILSASGVSGFLGNRGELDSVDPESTETEVFFNEMLREFGSEEFLAADLAPRCAPGGSARDLLPESVAAYRGEMPVALGQWLARHKNATHGGLTLRGRSGGGGRTYWRLERRR